MPNEQIEMAEMEARLAALENQVAGQQWDIYAPDAGESDDTHDQGRAIWPAEQAWWGDDFSFRFRQTSATGGDLTTGLCFLSGEALAITSLPSSLSSVTASNNYYWVRVELDNTKAYWESSTTSWPAGWGDDTDEIYPILHIACTDSKIASFIQHQLGDIHIERAA